MVIVIVFFAVSMTMLFFSLLSMISIFSLPSSSFSRMTWPLRDLMTRTLFLPSSLSAGGASLPFHSAPEHVREAHVAVLERDQHLVVDFGQEIDAAIFARHRRGDPRPVALVRVAQPREADLHPSQPVGILVVGHDADHHAVDPRRRARPARHRRAEDR